MPDTAFFGLKLRASWAHVLSGIKAPEPGNYTSYRILGVGSPQPKGAPLVPFFLAIKATKPVNLLSERVMSPR